jgi:hypothetical protein
MACLRCAISSSCTASSLFGLSASLRAFITFPFVTGCRQREVQVSSRVPGEKVTVAALTIPEGKTDHIEWDAEVPGFGVRLRGGSKRWIVQYRVGVQQRRESLGDVRKVKLEDARKIARQRFAQVELGHDPAAERAKVRQDAARSKLTLASVAARYLSVKQERLRPNTYKQLTWHFGILWAPLGSQPIDQVKRADVAARLQEITKAHGRTSAARARSNLSALFVWAMR